jgi:hypothetical protein
MEDTRIKSKLSVKGHYITAGYEVNETTVEEMLQFMGVTHDEAMIEEAIGFFSSHSMEINMNNLHEFLKGKQILSNKKDMRVKKNS